jgi:outer membrane receptor protein involved in Fe transport
MRRTKITSLLLGLLLAAFVPNVKAQAVYGSISGTVTDSQGAVVAGATVTITSVDRKTSDTVTTNDSGVYVKERLLPGHYDVKIELSGFKQALLPAVVVNVDTQTKLDAVLESGAVSDTVTITASGGQLLKTDRADVATTFDSKQITDLPILDRNFTRFVLLTPGAQQLSSFQHAASENPQASIQTQVNGQHFSGTGYQLDGTDNRDPILGIIVINPNFEAIAESKITTQNYDAEFGQATAGVISVQTKSGTNDIHGSAFIFRQNDVLQARNPFSQDRVNSVTGKAIPETLKNQFGGSIGGPIIKEKIFFFGDYQGTRSKVGGTRLLTVPTDLARTGDLSQYGVNIFDPTTRTQFAGNRIPGNRLSPQALAILDLIPRATRPGTRENFVASGSEIFNNDTFDVRVDDRLTAKLNMFGRYSFADFTRDGPTAFGAGGGQELVSLGGTSKVRNQSLAYGFDYTLSNTAVLDFRFGFFRYKVAVLPFDFGASTSADVGVPGLNLDDTFTSGLFGGFVEGPEGAFNFGSGLGVNRCNCPLDQDEKQVQFVSNLLKTYENHTFKFGVDVRRAYNLRVPSDRHRSGELTFATARTAAANGAGGLGLATFLLGDVTRFTRFASQNTDARERQWRHYYYAQDTWKATQKLTLNYGVRLDVINPQTVNEPGNGGFLDLTTGEIKVAGVGDIGLNGDVKNSLNWAPRLGIAYQLTEKTVIRAGYGRSYDIGVFGSLFGHSVTQNLPVLSAQELNSNTGARVFTLAQGPPAPVFPAVPSSGRFKLPDLIFARALPDKQRLPTVDAYNVTVQHQLTNTISVEAAYVGNKGTHVFAGDGPTFNVNQATIAGFTSGLSQDERKPFFAKFGWTQGIDFFCNCADNRYDALQTKFTKRFSTSYSVLAHYTWSRTIQEDGDQFIFDQSINRGPQGSDRTHSFTLATVADLPFGRGKRFLGDVSRGLDYAVGGWQFNTTTTISSGLPFTPSYRDCGAERDVGPCRPDLIGDPDTGGDQNSFFNATPIGSPGSAFARPAKGTFGNVGRNTLRGPGYWRTDASLFKKFRFTESKELEFRAEVGNLFNHVNLGQPDAEIGVPDNPNPNAGRITNTAFGGTDLQRNFQFALKFKF